MSLLLLPSLLLAPKEAHCPPNSLASHRPIPSVYAKANTDCIVFTSIMPPLYLTCLRRPTLRVECS
jgi:hypothetical protein